MTGLDLSVLIETIYAETWKRFEAAQLDNDLACIVINAVAAKFLSNAHQTLTQSYVEQADALERLKAFLNDMDLDLNAIGEEQKKGKDAE